MRAATAEAYSCSFEDPVRERFEGAFLAHALERLLALAGGGAVLDLGCCDGLVARLGGDRIGGYVGVDMRAPAGAWPDGAQFVEHDLRAGLGPLAAIPFDLCVATFGTASHLTPAQLRRLLGELAASGRPGAVVALEALGLHSLEWPQLWSTEPGERRTIPYRLAGDVPVHPWSPVELRGLFEDAGLRWMGALDRSVQAGQKLGCGRYWPGIPALRSGLSALLRGDAAGTRPLTAPLPPLPAHPAAHVHHRLAAARRSAVARAGGHGPVAVADRVWRLEPRSGAGVGHGVLAVARVA